MRGEVILDRLRHVLHWRRSLNGPATLASGKSAKICKERLASHCPASSVLLP